MLQSLGLSGYFGTAAEVSERKLSENRTFERIVECLNRGDGYVYSNGITYYLPKDGTSLLNYLETLDPESIDFKGPITLEQAKIAGLPCVENSVQTINLLEYLVSYHISNPDKIQFVELVKALLKKDANFNIALVTKCKEGLGIDLVELWAQVKGLSMSKSSIDDFLINLTLCTPNQATEQAVFQSFFLCRPIEDMLPACLLNKSLAPYIELFKPILMSKLNANGEETFYNQLLAHLVNHYAESLDQPGLKEAVKILIQKGVSFDIELLEKSKAVGLHLDDLWAELSNVSFSKSPIDQLYILLPNEPKQREAILYSILCCQPIENIFPSFFCDERLTQYTPIFIKAMLERLRVAEVSLAENRDRPTALLPDLTQSALPGAIIRDAEVGGTILQLSDETLKLKYALNTADIHLAAGKLLQAEQLLAKLLTKQAQQSSNVNSLGVLIEKSAEEIVTNTQTEARKKLDLEKNKTAFNEKWRSRTELTPQEIMERTKDAGEVSTSQEHYTVFVRKLAEKKANLEASKETLKAEEAKLEGLAKLISQAGATAKELAAQYTKLVKEKPELSPFEQIATVQLSEQDTFNYPVDLIKFLHSNYITMDQKGSMLFNALLGTKWAHIYPLLGSGILCGGLKYKEQDTVLACLARQYNEETSTDIVLLLAHIDNDALIGLLQTNIKEYCTEHFLASPALAHLIATNDNKTKPEGVVSK